MEVSQTALAWMLACSALCGACFGIVYDVLRWIRPWSPCVTSSSAQMLSDRLSVPPQFPWRPRGHRRQRLIPPKLVQGLLYGVLMIEDVLYCLSCAVALTLILYATGDGQMRLSALVAFGIGWGAYAATLGTLVRRVSCYLYVLVRATLAWTVSLAIAPFYLLVRFVWRKTAPLRGRVSSCLARYAEHIKAARQMAKERRHAQKQSLGQANESPLPKQPNGKHYFSTHRKENA